MSKRIYLTVDTECHDLGKVNQYIFGNTKKGIFGLDHWQLVSLYLVGYDLIAVTLAYFLALLFRFDFAVCRV